MATQPTKRHFSYTSNDFWGFYKKHCKAKNQKTDVSKQVYRDILTSLWIEIMQKVVKGWSFVMPQGLGTYTVRSRNGVSIKSHIFKKEGKRVIDLARHTSGHRFIFTWIKTGYWNNRAFYKFIYTTKKKIQKKYGFGPHGLADYINEVSYDQDWIEDKGLVDNSELDETLLIKWGTDAVNMIPIPDNQMHKIEIIYVENYKAELPKDFMLLQSAAANVWDEAENCSKTRREQIVQWTQKANDCELEINLVCPECHQSECSCRPKVVVDVDRIWEMANPQIYYRNYMKLGKVGFGADHPDYIEEKFKLMSYQSNDYFRSGHFLTDCPNIQCEDCPNQFRLELPHMLVDFKRGEILLSYIGVRTDENGDVMVPDDPDMLEAIQSHLTYKWFAREAARNVSNPNKNWQAYRAMSQEAKMEREDSFGKFRTRVTIPDIHDFQSWVKHSWLRRIPNFNNKGRLQGDQYDRYRDMLNGDENRQKRYY